jgi:hypothetical protein
MVDNPITGGTPEKKAKDAAARDYVHLLELYLRTNFQGRGLTIYREVPLGKSVIGKNRKLDIFLLQEATGRALAIECKFQSVTGTADEKIPFALADKEGMPIRGCVVYGGTGWSPGVLKLLQGSRFAAYCLPDPDDLRSIKATERRAPFATWELDHVLAMTFSFWDVVELNQDANRRKPRTANFSDLREALAEARADKVRRLESDLRTARKPPRRAPREAAPELPLGQSASVGKKD